MSKQMDKQVFIDKLGSLNNLYSTICDNYGWLLNFINYVNNIDIIRSNSQLKFFL